MKKTSIQFVTSPISPSAFTNTFPAHITSRMFTKHHHTIIAENAKSWTTSKLLPKVSISTWQKNFHKYIFSQIFQLIVNKLLVNLHWAFHRKNISAKSTPPSKASGSCEKAYRFFVFWYTRKRKNKKKFRNSLLFFILLFTCDINLICFYWCAYCNVMLSTTFKQIASHSVIIKVLKLVVTGIYIFYASWIKLNSINYGK